MSESKLPRTNRALINNSNFQFSSTRLFTISLHQLQSVHNENPHCPFCTNVDQTVSHLFVLSCPFTSPFWSDFIKWYQSISKKDPEPFQN